uniref:Uncharacterized protein n=1 Tax=Lepeophtheirus salmonis TaxID=72036 RepID=A0A0K2VEA4_LEPSM
MPEKQMNHMRMNNLHLLVEGIDSDYYFLQLYLEEVKELEGMKEGSEISNSNHTCNSNSNNKSKFVLFHLLVD